jgi:hypothetical protein
LELIAEDHQKYFIAGKPYSLSVALENGDQEGLAKVDVTVAEKMTARWVWLRPNEKKQVVFRGLIAPAAGSHQVRCGDIKQNLRVEP